MATWLGAREHFAGLILGVFPVPEIPKKSDVRHVSRRQRRASLRSIEYRRFSRFRYSMSLRMIVFRNEHKPDASACL